MIHRIVYRMYGMSDIADVKKVAHRGGTIYKCKLRFGEKTDIMKVDDEWIDIRAKHPTDISQSLGRSIERARM